MKYIYNIYIYRIYKYAVYIYIYDTSWYWYACGCVRAHVCACVLCAWCGTDVPPLDLGVTMVDWLASLVTKPPVRIRSTVWQILAGSCVANSRRSVSHGGQSSAIKMAAVIFS